MAKKIEYSVEDKLRALYDLQLIDSRIDKIKSVRGELPLEVEDLEDEVAGLDVRISKFNDELDQFGEEIKSKLPSLIHGLYIAGSILSQANGFSSSFSPLNMCI